jgi:hypothetical protein
VESAPEVRRRAWSWKRRRGAEKWFWRRRSRWAYEYGEPLHICYG